MNIRPSKYRRSYATACMRLNFPVFIAICCTKIVIYIEIVLVELLLVQDIFQQLCPLTIVFTHVNIDYFQENATKTKR